MSRSMEDRINYARGGYKDELMLKESDSPGLHYLANYHPEYRLPRKSISFHRIWNSRKFRTVLAISIFGAIPVLLSEEASALPSGAYFLISFLIGILLLVWVHRV